MQHQSNLLLTSLVAAFASTQLASAATLAINVGANSTIRVNVVNQGTSAILFAGDVNDNPSDNELMRTTVAFDLSAPELVGATINTATLSFFIREADGTSENATVTLNLHELTASFTNDGVTWTSRDGTNNWTTPGGDFGGILASASGNPTTVSNNDNLDFAGAGLTSAVQGAIGGDLNLLVKSSTEDIVARNLLRFASSRNTAGAATGPVLTLDYTPVPEPSAALLGGLGFMFLLRRRRNA